MLNALTYLTALDALTDLTTLNALTDLTALNALKDLTVRNALTTHNCPYSQLTCRWWEADAEVSIK